MNFENKRVLITGAASGLGRLTALKFAGEGAEVILVDNNLEGLKQVCEEIIRQEGKADYYDIDIADHYSLERLAGVIEEKYHSLDILVNDAGVSVYGEISQIPLADFKRVMDVNFFSHVTTINLMMPLLKKKSGVIVGVLSVLSQIPAPFQAPYVSSKFALKGFYEALHQELRWKNSKVRVATVLPSSLATPFFSHAKTYLGHEPKAFPPVYSPEIPAKLIMKAALKPQLNIVAGSAGKVYIMLYRAVPNIFHLFQATLAFSLQTSKDTKSIQATNNLYDAIKEPGTVKGKQSLYLPALGFKSKCSIVVATLLLAFHRKAI